MTDLLTDALGAIIEANPLKPSQIMEMTPEERKRQRDIANLKWLLSTFHIPTLQRHIEEAPYKVYHRVFYFWESFNSGFTNSRSFREL